MIKEVIDNWNKNKDKLEKYLIRTPQEKYGTYLDLVKLVVKYTFYNLTDYYDKEDLEQNIKTIFFGDYQGIEIYLISKCNYPYIEDIIYTHNYYGSCSGCDTLQMIQSSNYGEGLPTKKQVKDYMALCLHLVEKMKYLKGSDKE